MFSKYTVVRYVPRPLSGERINVGVIAWGPDGRLFSRFTTDWRRSRLFGREAIGYLREFAREVERSSAAGEGPQYYDHIGSAQSIDGALIESLAGKWDRSIQLSEPAASRKPPRELVEEVAGIFLPAAGVRAHARSRKQAAAITIHGVKSALDLAATAGVTASPHRELQGALDLHRFDVVAEAAEPLLAADGLSLERDAKGHRVAVDATAWAVDDVRKRWPNIKLGVMILPGPAASDLYLSARKIFDGLGAEVLGEDEVANWAMSAVGGEGGGLALGR